MHNRKLAMLLSLIVIVPFFTTGCVSKKVFRSNVDETATRMDSAESGIEANERRITDLRTDTDSKIAALEGRTDEAVEIHLQERTHGALASGCRVDEDVDGTELGKRRRHRFPIQHVQGSKVGPGHCGSRLLDVGRAATEARNRSAGFGEQPDRSQPDAGGAAEDQRPFSVDLHVNLSLWCDVGSVG